MEKHFDVVVIGGGAAGLVAATGAVGLGAKTALIEKKELGGDCTWYGCVPSKAILKAAQVAALTKKLDKFGIKANGLKIDTSGVLEHVRSVVQEISTHHPKEVFEKRGIDVIFGPPKFLGPRTLAVNGDTITAKRFIIATGSHPLVPPIEGLKDVGYLTNENIFQLTELPKSLIVLGGGPIGMEMAQAFSRLGVEVSIVEMFDRLMVREDKEVSDVVTAAFKKDGIKVYTGQKATRFVRNGNVVSVTLEDKSKAVTTISAERILVAVGRAPNVAGLDLEKAGVKYSNKGVEVDATLRTTASNIYACGDIAGPYQFSHMAEYQAVIVVGNALFPFKRKVDYSAVPWCTFTDPEAARVGLTEEEARAKDANIKVYRSPYGSNDRAVTDEEREGLAKVICDSKGYILGAHIVGANAGELIHEFVLAKTAKLKIGQVSSTIHIYPTLAQINKRAADQVYTDMLSSSGFKALSGFFLKLLR